MLAAWVAAIADVHAEYFEEYESWRQQLALPVSEQAVCAVCVRWRIHCTADAACACMCR